MNKCCFAIVASLVILFTGCQSDKVHKMLRVNAVPVSDFLPDHKLLVRQPDTFPFHYYYQKGNLDAYENVFIAPVDTKYLRESSGWAEFNKQLNGKLGDTVDDLAVFGQKAFAQAFAKQTTRGSLNVVNDPKKPKTLLIETAIVTFVPSKAELNAVGLAGSFVIPGLGLATSLVSAGSITLECRIRDARTGEVVAMFSNTESDPKAVLPISNYTWMCTARINIKLMAAATVKVMSEKDYRRVRRDSPIKFASLVVDGNLDK